MFSEWVATAYTWHSALRWPLMALSLVLIVRCAWLFLRRTSALTIDKYLAGAFAISMCVQGVLGLFVLIGLGALGTGWPLYRIGHGIVAVLAITASFFVLNDAPPAKRARNALLVAVGVVIITLAGVLLLPSGLSRLMAL